MDRTFNVLSVTDLAMKRKFASFEVAANPKGWLIFNYLLPSGCGKNSV
jgi:hypothetical protein